MIGRKLIAFVCVGLLCSLAWPSFADDAAEANRLMIEAVKLIQASGREPSPGGKFRLLKQAYDNLVAIIDRHPSSDLAVKLATGQRIGDISLARVREAMERARVPEPATPGAPLRVWRHDAAVVVVAAMAAPSGRRWALTASRDGVAAVRDIGTGELLATWEHRPGMSAAGVSRNGRRVLTGSGDGSVALRDSESGRVLVEWGHRQAIEALALSRDGGQALVGSGRDASLVEIGTMEVRHSWRHRAPVTAVARARGGRWILAGFADGRALLGDARTGGTVHQWKHSGSGGGGVTSAAFSPDGRRVLTGAANRRAVLREVATGATVHEWKVGYRVGAVAYSGDGRRILTGDDGYEVELHDTKTGRTLRKWRYERPPTALAFASGGAGALMGFADGAVILCDIRLPERRRGYERTFLTTDGGCW